MNDDELRQLLADLDPMSARVPVESADSPQARHRLEHIMSTDPNTAVDNAEKPAGSNVVPMRRRRGPAILAAAASVAVLAFGAVAVANMGGDAKNPIDSSATVLALKAPGGDASMQMCMRFDAEALKMVPMAFTGRVITLEPKTVTIDVDHWYKGGDADRVTIALPPGDISPALIPGVDFVEGKDFYVVAYDDVVSGCGFSGPVTPESEKVFAEAFPAS